MHDLGRDWRAVDLVRRRAEILGPARRGARRRGSILHLPPDQRQPIGFNKPANPDALGTLREAIAKVKEVPAKPAFMIHTGDINHLSKPDEFDNANQLISEAALDVHYVPGEHDFVDEGMGKAYLAPLRQGVPRARAGTPSTLTACISSGS
jgi:hypothetical protein